MFLDNEIEPPSLKDAPTRTESILSWIWFFIKPRKRLFFFLTANRAFRQIYFASTPLLLGKLLAFFETGRAFDDPAPAWHLAIAYVIVTSVVFVMLLSCMDEAGLGDRVSRAARLAGLKHLNDLSMRWLEQSDSGGKLQKIMNGAAGLKNLIHLFFLSLLPFFTGFIGAAITIYGMDIPFYYVLFFFGMMATYAGFAWYTTAMLERGYDEQNKLLESLVGKVYEFVNAAATVKIFNLGQHVLARARQGEEEGHAQIKKIFLIDYGRWVILNFIGFSWIALIVGLGMKQALAREITVAALAMAAYQGWRVWGILEDFTSFYDQAIENGSAVRRLIELLRIPPPREEKERTPFEQGDIAFNNVRFAYNTGKTVLDGFQLTIHAGEKVGIVGRSGSGKSTLVKLLLKFYDPDENEIMIDRQNIRVIDSQSLRQNIAVIPQDVSLFNQSVLENIRYGRLDASDQEVIESAKIAHAHAFIENLPQGYQTMVGEGGTKLSGGQKQRIAIARAVLKKAPILILDEATSALDSESERLIQASLNAILENRTVVAIAHRLSTVTMMDRLIVMDQGHIVETGTHQQLLHKNGPYAQLWQAQTNGFLSDALGLIDKQ